MSHAITVRDVLVILGVIAGILALIYWALIGVGKIYK